jgi:hypothetical protein
MPLTHDANSASHGARPGTALADNSMLSEILPLVFSVGATLAGVTSITSEWFQGNTLIGFAALPSGVDQLSSVGLRVIPLLMMALSVLFAAMAAKKSFAAPGSGMLWLILAIVAVGAAFLSFFNAITPGGLFGGEADTVLPAAEKGEKGRGLRDAHEAIYRILKKTAKGAKENAVNGVIGGKGGSNVILPGEIAAVIQVILCVLGIGCGFGSGKSV